MKTKEVMEPNEQNKKSGVFVVFTVYEDAEPEVNGIYRSMEKAEKMRDWINKCPTKDLNGYGNIKKVVIRNMFILD